MQEEVFFFPTKPYPLPAQSNPINELLNRVNIYGYLMSTALSALLVVLLLWHVIGQAFVKRLWLLPSHSSRFLALNAGTLALLGIVAPKPPKPEPEYGCSQGPYDDGTMLLSIVLICATIGAFMPSFAASTDLHDMWSNVAGVGLLVMSVNFITFLLLFYIPDGFSWPAIYETATAHKTVMAALFLLFLVLLTQALALEAMMSDMTSMVRQRLNQLCTVEAKPGYEATVILDKRAWSWEVVEQNTHIKLMMALTSNPQNLMSRSPSAAIVGAPVLLCVILFFKHDNRRSFFLHSFQGEAIVMCGIICVWRWARVALQEDRSFSSLVFAAEPSYWRRKVKNFQCRLKAGPHSIQPNALEEGQWGFQEVLWYTTAFFMLCVVLPLHGLLVALVRIAHILSAMLVQKIIWLPVNSVGCSIVLVCRAHFRKSCKVSDAVAETSTSTSFASRGVVCLEGEDARIVGREFASAANRIVERQLKKAKKTSDLKDLISHLQSFDLSKFATGKSKAIRDALNQEGTPSVENLRVSYHGYQFGWRLTLLSLLELLAKIEVTMLWKSAVSENAISAYWQAMDMMQLVDEQFVPCRVCSKDIYASACMSAWSKLQKKRRRMFFRWTEKKTRVKQDEVVRLDAVDHILKATLERKKRHIEELNNSQKSSHDNKVSAWSQQAVISYTMHTVCQNLSTCWSKVDVEAAAIGNGRGGDQESRAITMIEGMVEHINGLIREVLATCLINLPAAVDMSTTEAVQSGRISKVEKALLFVAQGKQLWKELQWPTLYSHRDTGLGQLKQWME